MPTSTRTKTPEWGRLRINLFAKLEVSCGAYRSFFVFSSYYSDKKAGCQYKIYKNGAFSAQSRKMGSAGGAIVKRISAAP